MEHSILHFNFNKRYYRITDTSCKIEQLVLIINWSCTSTLITLGIGKITKIYLLIVFQLM